MKGWTMAWRTGLALAAWGACTWAAAAAEVTVTNVTARQRYPWNGLVDIACTVEGMEGDTNGVKLAVAAVEESGKVRRGAHVRVVRDGAESEDLEVRENGAYELVWDARADLGAGLWSNVTVRVTTDAHTGVQLWEGGPYWAETNIGAEEPWEYGLYFWWGDTVGYKRENDAWVASDGSAENFSFSSGNTPTYGKNNATLQSEGWITAEGVLAPEHDAAQVQWGGGWRMPTDSEFAELINNTTTTWTTSNGVYGRLVTGKGDYASASIFLPAAGSGYGTGLYSSGSYGGYWSSTPYSSGSIYAWSLFFNSGHFRRYNGDGRYYGQSVRALRGFAE